MASLLAVAADLTLAAANGYYIRIDTVALLLVEWACVAAAVVVVLIAMYCITRLVRRPGFILSAPMATALFGALFPIAIVLLWRHRETEYLLALALTTLVIVSVAIMERRAPRPRAVGWIGVAVTVAATGTIVWSVTVPFPGRDMLALDSKPRAAGNADGERPNLIVIVADTLRADHLGAYGYDRPTSPWLDRFASTATVFENTIASSSYTLPSHGSLFTGLYAESHGAIVSTDKTGTSLEDLGVQADWVKVLPLSDDVTTLAETLRGAGYRTGAMCANSAYLSRAFNMDQGFDTYVDAMGSQAQWRPFGLSVARRLTFPGSWRVLRMLQSSERHYLLGNEINQLALSWMSTPRAEPYFLFLNYMEPHWPLFPSRKNRNLFPLSYARMTKNFEMVNQGEAKASPLDVRKRMDAYDAQIRTLDDHLSELFSRLNSIGALDNTCVVIVGDHGEAFGEHGRYGHHQSVYHEELHVPLILKSPGRTGGHRVEHRVHHADIMPTILRILGVKNRAPFDGSDLFAQTRNLPAVSYLGQYERNYTEHALYDGPLKLVVSSRHAPKLFDLQSDPSETHDLAEERPADVARLMDEFDEYLDRSGTQFRDEFSISDDETLERLRSLGYAG